MFDKDNESLVEKVLEVLYRELDRNETLRPIAEAVVLALTVHTR